MSFLLFPSIETTTTAPVGTPTVWGKGERTGPRWFDVVVTGTGANGFPTYRCVPVWRYLLGAR
jgi:hypothetical protein